MYQKENSSDNQNLLGVLVIAILEHHTIGIAIPTRLKKLEINYSNVSPERYLKHGDRGLRRGRGLHEILTFERS